MSGPFVDLPLTTGDFLTQTRQRQMNLNSKVPWERTARSPLPYDDFNGMATGVGNPVETTLTVKIDGSAVDTAVEVNGDGDLKCADIDISSFSVGLHTLQLRAATSGLVLDGKLLRFVRHEYLNRLSVWCTVFVDNNGSGPSATHEIIITNTSAIIHESVEGW